MRLPLASTLKNRTNETDKDARLLNAFAESKKGVVSVVKRPSIVATFAALEGGSGVGQGLFSYSTPEGVETLVGIQNDVLNNSPTPVVTTLAFTTQPVNWKISTAMSPSVVVTARNSFGQTMTSYTGTVTIAFQANPNGGTLSGTLSAAAVSGVATFSNLKIDVVGGGYSFVATASGLSPTISSTFKIISNLSFTVQPGTSQPGQTFDTPPEVSIVDSLGNAITGYVGNVTVALGANPASGTLSGTLEVAASSGVASFANLEIDNEGNGYTLIASADAGNLPNVTSNSFNIVEATHSLTAVDLGGDEFGKSASFGSISPTTLNAATIIGIINGDSVDPEFRFLQITLSGVRAQDFFTSVTISGVTFLTNNLHEFVQGSNTTWEWEGADVFVITAPGTYPLNIV